MFIEVNEGIVEEVVDNYRPNGIHQMESRLVHEQYVNAYLMLVIKVMRQNDKHAKNLVIVLLDKDLPRSVLIGTSVTGRMLSSPTNPVLKFLIENIDLLCVDFHQNLMSHFLSNHVFKIVVDQLASGEP